MTIMLPPSPSRRRRFLQPPTLLVVVAVLLTGCRAFQPVSPPKASLSPPTTTSTPNTLVDKKTTPPLPAFFSGLASLATAGTIFVSALFGPPASIQPASAVEVELSTGAIIVQTSAKAGQSILKTEVDTKDLVTALIQNRKALKESFGHVAAVVKEELQSPAVIQLTKELLQIEGDVAPTLTISPPRDIQTTLKDISRGKLNLIINGEIINLSLEKTSSEGADEIVVRAKGVKGIGQGIVFTESGAASKVRTRLEDQIDAIAEFWYSPVPLPASLQSKLPFVLDYGTFLLSGGVITIGGAYGLSYAYYLNEQEEEARKAEEKRVMLAEKKKKAAAAAKAKAAKDKADAKAKEAAADTAEADAKKEKEEKDDEKKEEDKGKDDDEKPKKKRRFFNRK